MVERLDAPGATLGTPTPWNLEDHRRLLRGRQAVLLLRVDKQRKIVGLDGAGLARLGLDHDGIDAANIFTETDPPDAFTVACDRAFRGEHIGVQVRWRGEHFAGGVLPVAGDGGDVGFADASLFVVPPGRPSGDQGGARTQLLNQSRVRDLLGPKIVDVS